VNRGSDTGGHAKRDLSREQVKIRRIISAILESLKQVSTKEAYIHILV
jgi:hypothetical protein